MKRPEGVRTWIEVDKGALRNNYKVFRDMIGKECKLLAVCKSNAYGHGLVDYAKTMEGFGADFLGVDSITEAMTLRREGIKTPILVLGYTLPELYEDALKNNISITISSLEQLETLNSHLTQPLLGQERGSSLNDSRFLIHIKVDTGMHRQGFQEAEIGKLIDELKKSDMIKIEGLYTHFAAAKNPLFPEFTDNQISVFRKIAKSIEEAGFSPTLHAAASAGAIAYEQSLFDMARIGIGLMGHWPAKEIKESFSSKIALRPALKWKTIISEIKEIKAGESIGYDLTHSFSKDTKIGILPIGYWHGYRRSYSNKAVVKINGKVARVIGRVSMDMVTVDLSEIQCRVGDEVTLLDSNDEAVSAENLADLAGTSNYEIITTLNPLIRRIYKD